MKNRLPKANCSICSQEIFDSVNPEKIITCARCVQILLSATQENKISFKNSLLAKEDIEGARSIVAFIVEEGDTDIATFKTSCRKGGFNPLVHRFKRVLIGSSHPITGDMGIYGKANKANEGNFTR
jgi:hypothetical protein